MSSDLLANNGHADRRARTHAETLEEPGRHIAAIGRRNGRTDGRDQGDDRTNDEDDAPAVNVGQGRPEERAKCESERGDGEGPTGLRIVHIELRLNLGERGDCGGGDVSEEEVPALSSVGLNKANRIVNEII